MPSRLKVLLRIPMFTAASVIVHCGEWSSFVTVTLLGMKIDWLGFFVADALLCRCRRVAIGLLEAQKNQDQEPSAERSTERYRLQAVHQLWNYRCRTSANVDIILAGDLPSIRGRAPPCLQPAVAAVDLLLILSSGKTVGTSRACLARSVADWPGNAPPPAVVAFGWNARGWLLLLLLLPVVVQAIQ